MDKMAYFDGQSTFELLDGVPLLIWIFLNWKKGLQDL